MDFSLSEEQQMLKDSIGKFVQNDYDFDSRMKTVNSAQAFNKDHWSLFAELGWLMVPFSEADGGLGGSAADLMVVMEEFGKGIVIEPFLATAVIGGGLIAAQGSEAQKTEILPEVMAGNLQMALAFTEAQSRYCLHNVATTAEKKGDTFTLNGQKSVVLNGGVADKIIVLARTAGEQNDKTGLSLFVLDTNAEGVTRQSYATQDGGQAAEISLNNVTVSADAMVGEKGLALASVEAILDRANLAICAEAVGAMEVTYQKTVEYTKTRVQFGVPISKFQALQHRMADMFIEHQQAKSALLMAAMQLDADPVLGARAVSAAKLRIGRAARHVGQEAVQIHGGIGVTDELDVGHFFKRLTMIEMLFGNSDYHNRRYRDLQAV